MTTTTTQEMAGALRKTLRWLGKLAADHDGDHIAAGAMKQYGEITALLARVDGAA
jgi:hypothetical protein